MIFIERTDSNNLVKIYYKGYFQMKLKRYSFTWFGRNHHTKENNFKPKDSKLMRCMLGNLY